MQDARDLRDAGMDWQQVRLNGGPPCFHKESDGVLCGRAERWVGHPEHHKYVPLAEFIAKAVAAEREAILAEVNATVQRKGVSRDRASASGRELVASHRQSDVETCEEIECKIRARGGNGETHVR